MPVGFDAIREALLKVVEVIFQIHMVATFTAVEFRAGANAYLQARERCRRMAPNETLGPFLYRFPGEGRPWHYYSFTCVAITFKGHNPGILT